MFFPLITFPYTSRILGPEGAGKINFATSFVNFFILLASIGIPLYGIRMVASIRNDKKSLSAVVQELFLMNLFTSAIVFLGFLAVIFLNEKLYDEKTLFFIISFSIILSTLGMDWLYQGLEDYLYITVRSLIFSSISVVAIFIFIQQKEDYLISAMIGVIASLGSCVLNFYNARKIIFTKRTQSWNFKRHMRPMAKVYLMNLIISFYLQIDTVMLGFMSSAKNVGYYTSAMKLTKMLLNVISSFSSVLLPRLSYYISNNLNEDFDRMLENSLRLILVLCLPIAISLMMFSKEIIIILAGDQYLPAALCIIITAPVILFIGLSNIFGMQILFPLGMDKKIVGSVASGAFVSIVLNLLLIPQYAHIGAAFATLIAEFVVFIVQLIMISKVHKFKIPISNIIKYVFATLSLVVLFVIIKFGFPQFWLRLVIAMPTGFIIYFGSLFMMKETFVEEIFIKMKTRFANV
jgi:O-antigen/teichoic acid export membrane protein